MSEKDEKDQIIAEMDEEIRQKDAAIAESKQVVIDSLVRDSRGSFSREHLEKLDLSTLNRLKRLFAGAVGQAYQDVLKDREEQRIRDSTTAGGTVGTFNQATGKYEGGIVE